MEKILVTELVRDWEAVYKRGLLTFWVLLALYQSEKRADEIKVFLNIVTDGQFSVDDQSLYRALRRYYDTEFVDFTMEKSNKGPDRKVYSLTPLGRAVLSRFAKQNIVNIMYKQDIQSLIERCAL